MSTSILSPFPSFNDLTGTPLENGFIYIGSANLNSETSPIQVYWDAEFTIPAAQPIRTIGGYPSRSGSPGNLHVQAETFSITVRDIRRALVFSAFNQTTATDSKIYNIGVQAITASGGQTVFTLTTFTYLPTSNTLQVYKNGLRLTLGADYTETNSSTVTLTAPASNGDKLLFQGGAVVTNNEIPATDVSFQPSGTGAVTRSIQEKVRESVSFKDFGAVGNGTTDDSTAVTAALATGSMIDGLGLTYKVTAQPSSYAKIKNAAFKVGYITYTTEDFLKQNTAKVTNAKAYTAWPQDKCYVLNNQIRLWANYGDSHADPDRRAVVFNSDDSGISFQEGEFLDETANGLTSWSAGTDGTYEYVFASTAAVSNQLNGAIDAAVTTLTLDSAYSFKVPGIVTIDSEQILYTGKTLTTLTGCTRGYNGTTAALHADNAPVSAGILSYMHKRTVPVVLPGTPGNSYAPFTRTLLNLPLPSFTTTSALYQHSFASSAPGTIVTGASNGDGAWLLKSIDYGANWTAHTLQQSTNAEEPTVKWDATSGKWYGFIRAGDPNGLLQFFVASADLATITRVPVPVGYFNANALIDSPVPFVIVNGVIHAFCSYRSGTDEGNASDKNTSAFYIQAVLSDVIANGNNIWSTSTTKTYYIGNLLHLEFGGASGCGVGSVVSYGDKVFLFYGSEERIGIFPPVLSTVNPLDRIVNIYQTVFPISEKAGFIDYRSKLPDDRSANNPAMRLPVPGGLAWKAKEGIWVWSKSGQLSASYVNAKASIYDYIFDLAATTGGIAISTDSASFVGYSVFNTLGAGPTGWFADGVGNLRFQINGTARYRWNESALSFRPEATDTTDLGGPTMRWKDVWASGTIGPSDERLKQDIASLDEAEKRVAIAIKGLMRKFRFKSAVEKKGDAARIHVGVIAQEVEQAFKNEGLDGFQYGLLCYNEWTEELDENGNVITPAGNTYAIRYDELLAFIIAAL